jgi:hypothetical protein
MRYCDIWIEGKERVIPCNYWINQCSERNVEMEYGVTMNDTISIDKLPFKVVLQGIKMKSRTKEVKMEQ